MNTTPYSFDKMWDLIVANHNSPDFSTALLIGIFWEETMFCNREQFKPGPAVGFGQVERSTLTLINSLYLPKVAPGMPKLNPTAILGNDDLSVKATGLYLIGLKRFGNNGNPKSKRSALEGYAGATNKSKVDQWLACESILTDGKEADTETRVKALRAAKPNSAGVAQTVAAADSDGSGGEGTDSGNSEGE
ncbi:MAG: hypothetical protein NTY19_29105 [Planctomycetota bacterium]|nr:hypothetical protein [Planctomycetota bacterium]